MLIQYQSPSISLEKNSKNHKGREISNRHMLLQEAKEKHENHMGVEEAHDENCKM